MYDVNLHVEAKVVELCNIAVSTTSVADAGCVSGSHFVDVIPAQKHTRLCKSNVLTLHKTRLVAQRLGRWIRDQKVHGSIPSRCTTK